MTAEAKTDPNIRLTRELLEAAREMRALGVMDAPTFDKITMRHIGGGPKAPKAEPIAAGDIRALRERALMSQAVFARLLNLTPGYVSQLERGTKVPKGAALALLNVIRRKGVEAML